MYINIVRSTTRIKLQKQPKFLKTYTLEILHQFLLSDQSPWAFCFRWKNKEILE